MMTFSTLFPWRNANRAQLRLSYPTISGDFRAATVRSFPAVIGRGQQADLQLDDRFVSHVHCVIRIRDGQFVVQDLESLNGTFVNGKPVEKAVIRQGDTIEIGSTRIRVQEMIAGNTN